MRFRSSFLGLVPNGSPDGNICGSIDYNYSTINTTVKITVNGVVCVNTSDYSTFTTSTTTVGSLTVSATQIQTNGGIELEIPLVNIYDTATLRIQISKTGYYFYDNTFNIFGYDLGNDLNIPIVGNPDFDIMNLRDYSSQPTQVGNAYSRFTAFRQPFTNTIYVYNIATTQQFSQISYVDNLGNLLGRGDNIIISNPNTQTIKQIVNLGHYDNNGNFVVDSTCTSALKTLAPYNLEPCYSVSIITPDCSNTNPDCGCNGTCIPVDDAFTAYSIFNSAVLTVFQQDDTPAVVFTSMTLTYNLYDLSGSLVNTQAYTISTPVGWTSDPSNFPFSGNILQTTGDYVLQTVLSVVGLFTCTKVTILKGCVHIKITRTCGTVTLQNLTLSDKIVNIYNLTTVTSSSLPNINLANYLYQTITVLANTSVVMNLDDGWYEFRTVLPDTTIICEYVLILCNLEHCIVNYIKKIVCASKPACSCGGNCGKNCDKVSADTYNLNAVMTMLMTWTQMIKVNWFFSQIFRNEQCNMALFSSQATSLLEVLSIGDYISKAQDYCVDCGLGVKDGNNKTNKDSGCGCK